MRGGIKRVGGRDRRIATERVRRLAELLGRDDVRGAVEFVDRGRYNFLNRPGCARIDPLHRRDLSICLACGNFDRLSFFCRVERVGRVHV